MTRTSVASCEIATGGGVGPGRLPRPRTSLVGRADLLAEVRELLGRTRLLTFTGAGGSGKTRLAIELASRAGSGFPDGVHFVSLAAIGDPALVPTSVAHGVGLQDSPGRPLLEHLTRYLVHRKLLLVLDNFEQVLVAAGFVDEILTACGGLRIVVTSRAPLHLSGEQEFAVPPLPAPGPEAALSAGSVAAYPAVQLFVARAAAASPGFDLGAQNAAAIAGIVRRLDGLPLAIELAAAWVKVLPPAALLPRLENSLDLLTGGGRDAPDRQRALRATIAWSHDLLSDAGRRLLATLSVFRGGAGLSSVEAVCARAVELGAPVLDTVRELVDHSLLRLATSAPEPRYALLETVREFAAERLDALPEAPAVREAHAAHFRALAGNLAPPPLWPAREGLDLLELEHDNFRAVLDRYQQLDPGTALELANRLTAFWSARGHFSEGRQRLRDLLDLVPDDHPERVDALNGAAWLATDQGDRTSALALLGESIGRARAAPDPAREARALYYRGRARLAIRDPDGGAQDMARALELQTAAGDDAGTAAALWFAGLPALNAGDIELARERFERCAQLCDALDLPAVGARALQLLGLAHLERGDLPAARAALTRGVPAVVDIGDRFAIPAGLSILAGLAAKEGRHRSALLLAGAAAVFEEVHHTFRPEVVHAFLDGWLTGARATAGPGAAGLLAEGRRLTLDEALTVGLDDPPEDRPRAGPSSGLTHRETEVAALVARGMTNRQIAARLYLSVRTVEVHVDHILTKLGFRNRTQLAGWVHGGGQPRT